MAAMPFLLGSAAADRFDAMMPLLSDLAARGGFGVASTEHAAFIIEDDDGEPRCLLWPFSAEFQEATWEGPLPDGVVAIAHTHPRCCRQISAGDRKQAARLGLPVIAVSMGTLSVVDEQGEILANQRRVRWGRHARAEMTCQELSVEQ